LEFNLVKKEKEQKIRCPTTVARKKRGKKRRKGLSEGKKKYKIEHKGRGSNSRLGEKTPWPEKQGEGNSVKTKKTLWGIAQGKKKGSFTLEKKGEEEDISQRKGKKKSPTLKKRTKGKK